MVTKDRFESAVGLVGQHIPGFDIRYKDSSLLMKFLGFITSLFNKEFMTHYTTTFRNWVYYPDSKFVTDSYERALEILLHEFVHLWDRKEKGDVRHVLGYMFPQWLALIPLLLTIILPWFISPAWLVVLVGLFLSAVPLCPWPAPFRAQIELRGYASSMAFHFWLYHRDDMNDDAEWIASQFTGWGYYRMAPNRHKVLQQLNAYAEKIRNDTLTDNPFPIIRSFLIGEKP